MTEYDFTGFTDNFNIDRCNDADPAKRYLMSYTTHAVSQPGVLEINGSKSACDDDGSIAGEAQASGEEGIRTRVGVDSNHDGQDDLLEALAKWAAEHGRAVNTIPHVVAVGFAHPVEIVLSSTQVQVLLSAFVTASQTLTPAQVNAFASRLLQTFADMQANNAGSVADDLGSRVDQLLQDDSGWEFREAQMSSSSEAALEDLASGRGGNLTASEVRALSVELSDDMAPISNQSVATMTDDLSAAFNDIVSRELAGETFESLEAVEAFETAGLDTEVAGLLGDSMATIGAEIAADLTVDAGAILAGAVVGGVVVLVVGIVLVAAIWAVSHWNLFGDPHFATLDGRDLDIQAAGEFHLLRIPGTDVDIQGRFSPWNDDASYTSAVAVQANGRLVELRDDGGGVTEALIDGVPLPEDVKQRDLGDGAILWHSNGTYILQVGGDDPVTLTMWADDLAIKLPSGVETEGLLGNHNGNPADDVRYPDGTLVADLGASSIDGPYADSWRIRDDESLFTYPQDQSTADYTDRSFPAHVNSVGDFPDADVEKASATCHDGGVKAGPQIHRLRPGPADHGRQALRQGRSSGLPDTGGSHYGDFRPTRSPD